MRLPAARDQRLNDSIPKRPARMKSNDEIAGTEHPPDTLHLPHVALLESRPLPLCLDSAYGRYVCGAHWWLDLLGASLDLLDYVES